MSLKSLFAISSDGAATERLSTCQRRKIVMSSMFSVYRHGSWVTERKFNVEPVRIPWIIFAHSLDDSGCSCRVCRNGRTWSTVMFF